MMALRKFADKWCDPSSLPQVVIEDELNSIEKDFAIALPRDYRDQVLAVGLPSPTLALLSAIVDNEVDMNDLSRLNAPAEIKQETLDWRDAGLPANLLVIGADCSGNKFCFDLGDLTPASDQEAAVYLWDHDFLETRRIAPSFSAWMNGFFGAWSEAVTYADF
ncbi:MAG: SMI1/KNR4 family protein [Pseudomonadota bacterium]